MELKNESYNKPFDAKSFQNGKNAHVKDFYSPKQFSLKEFLARPFQGTKDHSTGEFKYSSEANTTGRYAIPNSGKSVDTKSVDVKDAYDNEKKYSVREYARGKDEYSGRGTAQGSLDLQYMAQPAMTIDQVRELLNKNK